MNVVSGIVTELRERKLWPVAVGLLVALVAIPVLLSKGAHAAPASQPAPAGLPIASRGSATSVSLDNAPAHSHLGGAARDPFAQQKLPAPVTAAGTTATSSSTASGASAINAASTLGSLASAGFGSSSAAPSTAGGSGSSSTPIAGSPTTIPSAPPAPAPTGLAATDSYHVALSMTDNSGGVNTIDPLERLSVLPSTQQALMVELGVLKGGKRVLFVVQPGTVVSGPGSCTPGPADCEILSLAQNQTEQLSVQSQNGAVPVALFAVTSISIDHHGSVAAANRARRKASAAGRNLLNQSTLDALVLFQYRPSLGAVVDLRNLTVGGN